MEALSPSNLITGNIPPSVLINPEIMDRPNESIKREFEISDLKEEPNKITIDFFAGENPNAFVQQPVEPVKVNDQPVNTQYINPGVNTGPGGVIVPQRSKEEIRSSMGVLITLLDYALSLLGQFIAGEGTQSQYTADTAQRKMLETALTEYFYEKQLKMSPFVALMLAMLGAYGFMIMKAIKTRFDKKKGKAVPVQFKKDDPVKQFQQPAPPVLNNLSNVPTNTTFKWLNPDPNITAKDRTDLDIIIRKNIYPMYIRNVSNGKIRKINYDPKTGRPIFAGKPAKIK